MITPKYEIVTYWEEADEVYVATVPDLPGCVAHGKTAHDAVKMADEAMQLWIQTAVAFGDEIPTPTSRQWMD